MVKRLPTEHAFKLQKVSRRWASGCLQASSEVKITQKKTKAQGIQATTMASSMILAAEVKDHLRLGTDCSGLDAVALALQGLPIPYTHVFASDVDPAAKATIMLNYKVNTFYDTVVGRNVKGMDSVDLYAAGFPCQPFSLAGKKLGACDDRGGIFFELFKYLAAKTTMILFENVTGLLTLHPAYLALIEKKLRNIGYYVEHNTMNACDHGLPHNRDRLIVLGTQRSAFAGPFDWPPAIAPLPLSSLLDKKTPEEKALDVSKIMPRSNRVRKQVAKIYNDFRKSGIEPSKTPLVIDIDSSCVHAMHGRSPCLTRTRSANGGHWLSQRGRRQSIPERERLMGFNLKPPHGDTAPRLLWPSTISDREKGALIGNSIALPILQRILARNLPKCFKGIVVADPWSV